MEGAGDFFERVAAVEVFPQIVFLRAQQQITVLTKIFQDEVARAVRAGRLRGDLPFRLRQPPWFVRPVDVVAVDLEDLKSGFAGGSGQQLELRWIGHESHQVDLRPKETWSLIGEYPVASRPQRIASRACSLVARSRSMKTVISR